MIWAAVILAVVGIVTERFWLLGVAAVVWLASVGRRTSTGTRRATLALVPDTADRNWTAAGPVPLEGAPTPEPLVSASSSQRRLTCTPYSDV